MNTIELQESIIQKVRLTDDEQLLDYLNQLLSNKDAQETYQLSDFEKSIIEESKTDSGKTGSNDLKTILHYKIDNINNDLFLTTLIDQVDAQSDISIYMTTDEQKERISEGCEQIAKGNYYTNEQVEKEIDEWLNKE